MRKTTVRASAVENWSTALRSPRAANSLFSSSSIQYLRLLGAVENFLSLCATETGSVAVADTAVSVAVAVLLMLMLLLLYQWCCC